MTDVAASDLNHPRRYVRLDTILRLRWLAALGQLAAIFIVAQGLEFDLPIIPCVTIVGLSSLLNLALQVIFDPKKLSYEQLLGWFFRMHDPTTKNRQGNDVGTQYRSAIFYHSPQQKEIAEKVKAKVEQSGKWKRPIVTEIVPAGTFTPAEEYHQDYLQKNPGGYTCHYLRDE